MNSPRPRYTLAQSGKKNFLTSGITTAVLKALTKAQAGLSYDDLEVKTKASRASLYVIVGRLKAAGLIRTVQNKRTGEFLVEMKTPVELHKATAVHL